MKRKTPIGLPNDCKWGTLARRVVRCASVIRHYDGWVLLMYKSATVPYPKRKPGEHLSFGIAKAPTADERITNFPGVPRWVSGGMTFLIPVVLRARHAAEA